MSRFFNTEGPSRVEDHYTLPPLGRLDLDDVLGLIDRKKYFVLHAPRQTGKTTCLLALRDHLNREGKYLCVYADVEVAQGLREQVEKGLSLILREITRSASRLGDATGEQVRVKMESEGSPIVSLADFLARWCAALGKPLVLFLDEIDSLVGDMLVTVLRHLRAGYHDRPAAFPQSVILCGVRDVRDYRLRINGGREVITGGSAFNIKAKSLRLGDFERRDVEALYQQHTEATGQRFEQEALDMAWDLTQGQPWLVNALAYEVCFEKAAGRDRSQPITRSQILAAKEALILARVTHLNQLADKLREERVRLVIEALLTGSDEASNIPGDDIEYVADLGLIRLQPVLAVANPIYREVIPRELTLPTERMMTQEALWYVKPDGALDVDKLLASFQAFFRANAEHWVERFQYKEAGPQLLLQAFLHRIVNGGGRIEREYGLGRLRTDLLVIWPAAGAAAGGEQQVVIELKLLRGDLEKTIEQGLAQTLEYQDRTGAPEAHLVIFDRRPGRTWEEKLFRRVEERGGRRVVVWGM
jgi:hypothetical protein